MKTLKKPLIGIASTGYEGNPCNMHLNDLAQDIKVGVNAQSLVGLVFNTIGVSDGISMGTPGMRFSYPHEILSRIQLKRLYKPCRMTEW